MSVPPTTNQFVRIVGSLEVYTEQDASTDKGQIKFAGPFGSDYGKIKAIGYGGFGNLLVDCANLQQGFVVRTAANQDAGIAGVYGPFAPYSLKVTASGCVAPSLLVDASDYTFGTKRGDTVFQVKRMDTSEMTATRLQSCIAALTQNVFRAGESIMFNMGFGATYGNGGLGFYTPTGSSSDAGNRLFLGVYDSNAGVTARALSVSATNVEIPNRATIGTVFATTYENLPPFDVAVLAPMTLDAANARVGVNQPTPLEALDVVGNITATGTVTAGTVSATHWVGLPSYSPAGLSIISGASAGPVGSLTIGVAQIPALAGTATLLGTLSVYLTSADKAGFVSVGVKRVGAVLQVWPLESLGGYTVTASGTSQIVLDVGAETAQMNWEWKSSGQGVTGTGVQKFYGTSNLASGLTLDSTSIPPLAGTAALMATLGVYFTGTDRAGYSSFGVKRTAGVLEVWPLGSLVGFPVQGASVVGSTLQLSVGTDSAIFGWEWTSA